MVFIRLTSSLIGFLFISFVLKDFIAQTEQALKMTMISDNNGDVATGGDVVSFDQELSKGIPTAVTRNGKLRGRKMLVNDVLSKGLMKGKGLNQETSKISGANHSKKGDLNIDSKLSDSSLLPVKVNMIGTFSADYHAPNHHPPKNN